MSASRPLFPTDPPPPPKLKLFAGPPTDGDDGGMDAQAPDATAGESNPRFLDFVTGTYLREHVGLKPGTATQYTVTARQLEEAAGGPVHTRDLSRKLAVDYRTWLVDQKRSSETVASKWNNLRVLWRYAHKLGLADAPPDDLPAIKKRKRKPKAWQLDEMERLIQAAYQARPGRGWEGRHWVALLLVIYDTGLRISSALKIKTTQLSLERATLRSPAEDQKDGEELVFPLHAQTVLAIRDALEAPRDLLFPWPFSREVIWRRYEEILIAAQLLPANASDAERRRAKFHKLRRTSASWLESVCPGAATAHLGHSDRSTTVKSYLDPEITRSQVNAVEALPRFRVEPPAADRDGQLRLF